jgi:hypothetical protein
MAAGEVTVTGDAALRRSLLLLTPSIRAEGTKTVLKLTFDVARAVKREIDTAGLHRRTGALVNSVQSGGVKHTSGTVTGTTLIGQGLPYARAQEDGATIVPTHGQYLAVPLAAALTPAGVARFAPRDATSAGYSYTFIEKGIIFGAKWSGSRGENEAVPLFKLVRSVTIPARPFARPAFARMRPTIETELTAAVQRGAHAVL